MSPRYDYIQKWVDAAIGGGSDHLSDKRLTFTSSTNSVSGLYTNIAALGDFLYGNEQANPATKGALPQSKEAFTTLLSDMANVVDLVEKLLQHIDEGNQIDKLMDDGTFSSQAREAYRSLVRLARDVETALKKLDGRKTITDIRTIWTNSALTKLDTDTGEAIDAYLASQKYIQVLELDYEARRREAKAWMSEFNFPSRRTDWLEVDIWALKANNRKTPHIFDYNSLSWWTYVPPDSHNPEDDIKDVFNKKVAPLMQSTSKPTIDATGKVGFNGDPGDDGYFKWIQEAYEERKKYHLVNIPQRQYWGGQWRYVPYAVRQRMISFGLNKTWDDADYWNSIADNLVTLHNSVYRTCHALDDAMTEVDDLNVVFFDQMKILILDLQTALYNFEGNVIAGSAEYAKEDGTTVRQKLDKIKTLNQALIGRKPKGPRPSSVSDNKLTGENKGLGGDPGNGKDWIYGLGLLEVPFESKVGIQMQRTIENVPHYHPTSGNKIMETRLRWLKFPEHIIPNVNFGTVGDFSTAHRHTAYTWEWDIRYERRFQSKPPVVRTWLDHLELEKEVRNCITVDEVNVTQDGFTLVIHANDGMSRALGASASWFAYDIDNPDVWTSYYNFSPVYRSNIGTPSYPGQGMFGSGPMGTWDRNMIEEGDQSQSTTFPSGKFKSKPNVLIVAKALDFETLIYNPNVEAQNMRLFSDHLLTTKDRIAVKGGTWAGSFMRSFTCLVIACA